MARRPRSSVRPQSFRWEQHELLKSGPRRCCACPSTRPPLRSYGIFPEQIDNWRCWTSRPPDDTVEPICHPAPITPIPQPVRLPPAPSSRSRLARTGMNVAHVDAAQTERPKAAKRWRSPTVSATHRFPHLVDGRRRVRLQREIGRGNNVTKHRVWTHPPTGHGAPRAKRFRAKIERKKASGLATPQPQTPTPTPTPTPTRTPTQRKQPGSQAVADPTRQPPPNY